MESSKPPPAAAPPPLSRQPTMEMERIRHVPDWEIPVNPPKKSYWSKFKPSPYSRSRSRSSTRQLSNTILPLFTRSNTNTNTNNVINNKSRPTTPANHGAHPTTTSLAGTTNISSTPTLPHILLNKETSGGGAPTPLIDRPSSPTSFYSSPRPPTATTTTAAAAGTSGRRNVPPILSRIWPPRKSKFSITFWIFVILLIILSLALGLGLGLGLRRHKSKIPLPWSKSGSSVQSGELTYYSPSVGVGACGLTYRDDDPVVAVGHELWDQAMKERRGDGQDANTNNNKNPLCGLWIRVMRDDDHDERDDSDSDKEEVMVQVVDRCTGCGVRDLDLSVGAFGEVADLKEGRVEGKWEWVR